MKVLDLFAGAGGLSYGLNQHNCISIEVANEFDIHACKTYNFNHPNTSIIQGDITDPKIKTKIISESIKRNVNTIVGGIPCVTFSISGKRNPCDLRGRLYLDYFEMVKVLNPKLCLIENVAGLKSALYLNPESLTEDELKIKQQEYIDSKNKKKFVEKNKTLFCNPLTHWISIFTKLNYFASFKLLSAADFGVPQTRNRIIILASKIDNIIFPEPTHNEYGMFDRLKWVTVKECIDDLKFVPKDEKLSHVFRKYKKNSNTLSLLQSQKIGTSYTNYTEANFKCFPDKPAPTVKENHGGVLVHYELPRHLTPRELARLQSFPDEFIFACSKTKALIQIGNAVPVGLAFHLGYVLIKIFTGIQNESESAETNIDVYDDKKQHDNEEQDEYDDKYNSDVEDSSLDHKNELRISLTTILEKHNIKPQTNSTKSFIIEYLLSDGVDLSDWIKMQDIISYVEIQKRNVFGKPQSDRKRALAKLFNEE